MGACGSWGGVCSLPTWLCKGDDDPSCLSWRTQKQLSPCSMEPACLDSVGVPGLGHPGWIDRSGAR